MSAKIASARSSANESVPSDETSSEKSGSVESDVENAIPAFPTRGSSSARSFTTGEDHRPDERTGKLAATNTTAIFLDIHLVDDGRWDVMKVVKNDDMT